MERHVLFAHSPRWKYLVEAPYNKYDSYHLRAILNADSLTLNFLNSILAIVL